LRGAAVITALLAGVAAAALGMGKGGPLVVLKFLFPALAIELGALVSPRLWSSHLLCALIGAVAGATKFFSTAAVDLLVGMDSSVIWAHALFAAATGTAFGILGGLCLPPVLRRLQAYGVLRLAPGGERA
jgi:hypothetical protein